MLYFAAGDVVLTPEGAVVQGVGSGAFHSEQKDMVMRAVVHIDTNE